MICPHDHQECDNRGCRYGGCQGRPSGVLVAHKDPRFRKNIAIRSQNSGTASAPAADPPAVSGSSAGSGLTTEGYLHPTRLLTPDVTAIAASPQLTVPQEERN